MKKYLIIISIVLFSIALFVGLDFWQDNPVKSKNSKIIFFDVGQGDSAMISTGDGMQILIDGGDGNNILEKLGKYMPLLDHKIELVVMTHPDKDHMGGLVEVLKYYQVEQILETGIKCNKTLCKEWDRLIEEKNIPVINAYFGQRIKTGDFNIAVLYPFKNLKDQEVKNSNDASIILKFILNNDSYLLTGDAGFPVERELLDKNINIEAKILKVSHHGSKYATSNEFLQIIKPEKAIVSVGKNSYGHPTEELLNRLKNMSIDIFRTDKTGDVIFE